MMSTKTKSNRQDIDAIAESVLEKQRDYLEPRLSQIQQVGKDNDEKLSAIHAELAALTAGLGAIRSDVNTLKSTVASNSSTLNSFCALPGKTRSPSKVGGFASLRILAISPLNDAKVFTKLWTQLVLKVWNSSCFIRPL